jgi:transcriptional regulator with XRE-family HTH domain
MSGRLVVLAARLSFPGGGSVELRIIVGRELRRLRERERLTQREVAWRLALPPPVIGRRERGKHEMWIENIAEHAEACGGSLGHVLIQVDLALGTLCVGGGR